MALDRSLLLEPFKYDFQLADLGVLNGVKVSREFKRKYLPHIICEEMKIQHEILQLVGSVWFSRKKLRNIRDSRGAKPDQIFDVQVWFW